MVQEIQRTRGRPRKYRDLSQQMEGARLRKQQQRQRERDAGLQTCDCRLSRDVLAELARTAAFTFTDPKTLAADMIAAALPAHVERIERLAARAGAVWLELAPAQRTGAEDPPAALAGIRRELARLGWPPARANRFIRRCGERACIAPAAVDAPGVNRRA